MLKRNLIKKDLIKKDIILESDKASPSGIVQQKNQSLPESGEEQISTINWTPRKTILKPIPQKISATTSAELDNIAITPVNIISDKAVLPEVKVTPPQYTIQVGAYKTKINARQMAGNLSKKGYDTYKSMTDNLNKSIA